MLSTERPYSHIKSVSEKAKAILSGVRPGFQEEVMIRINSHSKFIELFNIMKECCNLDPIGRPTMQQVLMKLRNKSLIVA